MSFEVQRMDPDEFAACQIARGERAERHGGVWWLRARRFFYRPLLPYQTYSLPEIDLPPIGFGGLQYAVANPQEANATMSLLMLENVRDYSLDAVSHNRRRLIKNAARQFVIHPMRDVAEFKEQGFVAYSSFYQRTHYKYKSERIRRDNYARWVDTILECPKAFILGGYERTGRLEAVSISYCVEETLIYSTFFSKTSALRKGIGELMFHALRETACSTPGLREVFVRRYQGGNGMDSYYLMRGARLVVKPAKVRLHPVARLILKFCFPPRYAALGTATNHEPPNTNEESHSVLVQNTSVTTDDRS
jgi:hypothetical protein